MKDGASVLDARPGHHGAVVAVAWLPGERGIITAGTDRKLLRWDLEKGKVVAQRVLVSRATVLAVDPRGRWVAVGDVNGSVALHVMNDLSPHRKLSGGDGAVRRLAFDPRGTNLAAANCGSTLVAWEPASGVERFRMTDAHSEELEINGLVYSSDGRLFTAGRDGAVRERNPSTGRPQRTVSWLRSAEYGKARHANGLALSADGKRIAVATDADDLRVVDVTSGAIVWQEKADTCTSASICFAAKDRFLVIPHPHHVELHDAVTGKLRRHIPTGAENTVTITASPTSAMLAVGRADSLVTLHRCTARTR